MLMAGGVAAVIAVAALVAGTLTIAGLASARTAVVDHRDPALLNTTPPTKAPVDDSLKVAMAPSDFKQNPHTTTSETFIVEQDSAGEETKENVKRKGRVAKARGKQALGEAERETAYYWEVTKEQLLRPGVAGGLMGIVNVGLLAGGAYALYNRPALRSDVKTLGWSGAGLFTLFAAEGFLAESYRETASGQEEERKARERGSAIYHHTKEVVLRPGVLGGIVGVLNLGVLGAVGYVAYDTWDRPVWDRKIVSAISIGLLALWGGEGYLAEQYKENELPKRR